MTWKRTREPWKRWAKHLAIATVIGGVSIGGAGLFVWSTLLKSTQTGPASIEIAKGTSTTQVLHRLSAARLLPSVVAGRIYFEVMGRGRTPHWGRYHFDANSRPIDVLEAILEGSVETFSLTIPEGAGTAEIGDQLELLEVPGAETWDTIVGRTEWIANLAPEATSLEGFLFPDTYSFHHGTDAPTVARALVERFRDVWAEESKRSALFFDSVYDTVILASLVEAETSIPEERPRVAGVFVNRLGRGMLLQCDPTVVYALRRRGEWSGRLLRSHWTLDDPYNTYVHPGLPPGPINNPGRAALAAAIAPEAHSFLYFVAQPGGGHAFSRTLKEHNQAVARLRRARH